MYYIIYQITNTINGKIYIGKHQTSNLNDGYMGSGKLLKLAISKYGIENFSKEILFFLNSEEEMNLKEIELVNENFCLREDVYNVMTGGRGGKIVDSEIENRRRISISKYQIQNNKRPPIKEWTDEQRTEWSNRLKSNYDSGRKNGFKNKNHSEETRQQMSKSAKNRKTNSQSGTMWITDGNENKKIKNNDTIPQGWKRGRSNKG